MAKYLEFSFSCAESPLSSTLNAQPGARACVEAQRARFLEVVRPLVNPARPVVLVDMPTHWNLGDSFIWLGDLTFMDALGVRQPPLEVMPACHVGACDMVALARVLGKNGTILMHGGGNFGYAGQAFGCQRCSGFLLPQTGLWVLVDFVQVSQLADAAFQHR